MESLPIDNLLPQVVAFLSHGRCLVVTAVPGAGKTTRIPRAIYEAGISPGEILVLEPRRLAARMAAARVAQEMGETVGQTVGYSVRFETADSIQTRIRYITEGIFARRIVQDSLLRNTGVVILDEFHERHVAADLALAFLRRLQLGTRPDLRIVVMSATLDAEAISVFLGGAPVLSVDGHRFDVEVEYERRPDPRPLHERVCSAAAGHLATREPAGDVLVFLPGAAEIRRAAGEFEPLVQKSVVEVLTLHGDLPVREQMRVFQPSRKTRIILSTNVAETSITIPGITTVIDSGLVRRATYSHWNGLPATRIVKISQASARQRAGRAGRTGPGEVIRLYTRHDFDTRPQQDLPEITRADLAETVLVLRGAGIRETQDFPWFESPSGSALAAAEEMLGRLGALDPAGALTALGRRMLRFPLHPRLARLVLEGEAAGVPEEAALVAAIISEGDMRLEIRGNPSVRDVRRECKASGDSDVLELCDVFGEAEAHMFDRTHLERAGLDPRTVANVERARRQLERLVSKPDGRKRSREETDPLLLRAILVSFPDRVAARRSVGAAELLLCSGGTARLSGSSVVRGADLLVAVDAEERMQAHNSRPEVIVRIASAVEREWLSELFTGEVTRTSGLVWNEEAGRVDKVSRTSYGQISLEEMLSPAPASKEASSILASAVSGRARAIFPDYERCAQIGIRLVLLAKYLPSAATGHLPEHSMHRIVRDACAGRRSLRELQAISLSDLFLLRLSPAQRSLVDREAPEQIFIGGRKAKVRYAPDKSPWIESRLQDFFGLRRSPAICAGRLPLTLHLLAPNGRPVQVTQDLDGFWRNHYPAIRRELMRRYPKHAWPAPETVSNRGK